MLSDFRLLTSDFYFSITCDKTNIASAKTIIKNGGVLENEQVNPDRITQRYWITLASETQ
jgi:predicted acetyltransferase